MMDSARPPSSRPGMTAGLANASPPSCQDAGTPCPFSVPLPCPPPLAGEGWVGGYGAPGGARALRYGAQGGARCVTPDTERALQGWDCESRPEAHACGDLRHAKPVAETLRLPALHPAGK